MQSINMKSHVGHDGVLKLQVPIGMQDMDLDITVIVQRSVCPGEVILAGEWPPDFLDEIAGRWQGEALVRGDQGTYEAREMLS